MVPKSVEIPLDEPPLYERIGPECKRLRDGGASVNTIVAALGITWEYVRKALECAETGKGPDWDPKRRLTLASS